MDPLLVMGPVLDIDLLEPGEASAIAKRIHALEPLWIKRGPGFATLGVAAYLDVMHADDPEANYYGRIPETNAVLWQEFDWLLERVRIALSAHFDTDILIDCRVALPGFHIFYGPGITIEDRDTQHFDLQFRAVHWPFAMEPSRALSFTLALQLPRLGGGLDYWAFTEEDIVRLERLGRHPRMGELGRTKPFVRHPYRAGRMAVQTMPVMHRIASIPNAGPEDYRITLQGHTIGNGEAMVMYW